jgi:ParB-like chromosome segregation protein Spo0J
VVWKEENVLVDGHHRVKICKELGIEYPVRVIEGLGEERKQNLSIELNMHRRHLTNEQKRELAASLRSKGWNNMRIARVIGVDRSTVGRWFPEDVANATSGQHSLNLNQDELLTLKNQLNAANERVKTFESEIERLKAAEPRVTEKAGASFLPGLYGLAILLRLTSADQSKPGKGVSFAYTPSPRPGACAGIDEDWSGICPGHIFGERWPNGN